MASHLSKTDHSVWRLGLSEPDDASVEREDDRGLRSVPIEAPVSIEYNGIGYAVMMATPAELEAYAVGFTLAEALVERADEIGDVDVHQIDGGWIVRVWLPRARIEAVIERARTRVSESSCGLCGIENIEQVLRPLPMIDARISTTRGAIAKALADLRDHQPLGQATGAVHAAAFCTPGGDIVSAHEDVGRHNALDKLVGALAMRGLDVRTGFILLSARCSYELVEKTVRSGCPMLVTISAPTSLAVERAIASDLTLVSLARPDSALVVNDPFGSIA
ncbi:MAG: formate dehydrogenase accessory sulfurtransferase FdhD [Pseudomonadota bacterium]